MNRLKEKSEEEPEPEGPGTYFVVSARTGSWHVSTVMAAHIEACLDAGPRPGWVRFVDNVGARIRVRTRDIEYLEESTAAQRAANRAFSRSMRREYKADRNWEDDD